MSKAHPIVAVTGSSGAGTTTIRHAFSDIFRRQGIQPAFVNGDSFHRYDHETMGRVIEQAQVAGLPLSHFGPDVNLFEQLETLFTEYGRSGGGTFRQCITEDNCVELGGKPGTFTQWGPLPADTDLLFYEGLHGGVVARTWTRRQMSPSHNPLVAERRSSSEDGGVDVAQHVDLLLGVVPVVNLEWIQKIHRDTRTHGYSVEAVTNTILRRMRDYISFIVPQFSVTDINFQRVPVVDTSNPFISRDVPLDAESIVVIRFRDPQRFNFPQLLREIHDSYMSRPNTLVIPGSYFGHALEVICAPLIHELCSR